MLPRVSEETCNHCGALLAEDQAYFCSRVCKLAHRSEIRARLAESVSDLNPVNFAAMLIAFRLRAKWPRRRLALEIGVDPSYLTRLEDGDREPPRQHIVEALAAGLRLSTKDRNRFLVAAGYAPYSVVQAGGWNDVLQAVTDVLNDYDISAEDRDAFRNLVITSASHWHTS